MKLRLTLQREGKEDLQISARADSPKEIGKLAKHMGDSIRMALMIEDTYAPDSEEAPK